MKNKTLIIICSIVGAALIVGGIIVLLFTPKSVKVTFDSDGGSSVESQEIKKGEMAHKPLNPTKEKYEFAYWSLDDKEYDFSNKVENDIELKAIWSQSVINEKKYILTFDVNGKTKTIEVENASEIHLDELEYEEKKGYEIKWYVNGEEYDFTTPLEKDITIIGKYEKVDTSKYTVKFNANGGSKVANQILEKNEVAKEPEISRYGYILEGWYLNNQKYDFTNAVTANITLVANWKEDPNIKRYEIKFEVDEKIVTTKTILEGEKVVITTEPSKYGYKFEGWYLGKEKYNANNKVTEDITLVAKFTELPKYEVSFDCDGGKSIASQSIFEGEMALKPTPIKEGYTFKEWQLDGKPYDFETKVTKNIKLKAIYVKDTEFYTVTFESDGKVIETKKVEEGQKVEKPKDPTKEGYKFKEWQLEEKTYDFDKEVVTGNITLKASYVKKKIYTVTFESDGKVIETKKVEEGQKVEKPKDPTKEEYKFKEWQLDDVGYDFNRIVDRNIVLKAYWEEIPKTYKIKATRADNYSPDSILTVYEDGKEIEVKEIKYTDGVHLCDGTKLVVATNDIKGETKLIVVLLNDKEVKATIE